MARKKINRNEIDYLHPNGKPEMGSETIDEKNRPIEDKMRESKTSQKAIEEADGHHVCSQKCQKHHSVKATGADKTQ